MNLQTTVRIESEVDQLQLYLKPKQKINPIYHIIIFLQPITENTFRSSIDQKFYAYNYKFTSYPSMKDSYITYTHHTHMGPLYVIRHHTTNNFPAHDTEYIH